MLTARCCMLPWHGRSTGSRSTYGRLGILIWACVLTLCNAVLHNCLWCLWGSINYLSYNHNSQDMSGKLVASFPFCINFALFFLFHFHLERQKCYVIKHDRHCTMHCQINVRGVSSNLFFVLGVMSCNLYVSRHSMRPCLPI